MAQAPVTPGDFEALISSPGTSMCGNFINTLLKLPVTLWRLVDWMFDSDGNPSANLASSFQKPGDLIFSAAPVAEDSSRLLCDGRQVSKTTYASLYTAIQDIYGGGTTDTFALPDYRGRFPVGVGTFASGRTSTLAVPGGEDQHLLVENEIPDHHHADDDVSVAGALGLARRTAVGENKTAATYDTGGSGVETDIKDSPYDDHHFGGDQPHENLPPYLPCFIYIKT